MSEAGEPPEASPPSTPSGDDGDHHIRLIHVVQKTIAPTSRTTLDLLSLPFPFSQVDLLDPSEFVKAAAQRRIMMWGRHDLDVSGLQELHRHGILVPFYCVSIADEPTGKPIDVSASLTAQHVHGTQVSELYRAAADCRLTDPAAEPFTSWPTERVRILWPTVEKGYLYSYHQLLSLEHAGSIVASLRPRFFPDHRREWFIPGDDLPNDNALEALESWRGLAISLATLDTRAWPRITQRVHHSAVVWRAANLVHHPPELAEWLGVTIDQLRHHSRRLRVNASFGDVLGDFYDVVRRARPGAWDSLLGDARCAMDERMAAEVLDRFADEIEGAAAIARPAPPESLSQQGLSHREHSLGGALTDLHLSPHPPLVVALEGKTEMTIFPRVLAVLGATLDPHRKDRPTMPIPDASPCANRHPLDLRELLEEWHVPDVRHAGGEHEWLLAQFTHPVDQPSQAIFEASVTKLRARRDGAGVVAFLLKHQTSANVVSSAGVSSRPVPCCPRTASG